MEEGSQIPLSKCVHFNPLFVFCQLLFVKQKLKKISFFWNQDSSYSTYTDSATTQYGGHSSSSAGRTSPPSNGRDSKYRGVRSRSGKWVSEIREPRKTSRIWLGTYSTPDMAAAAYDVAALALKGPETTLNFPNLIYSYPVPASTSANDIRAAAARAGEAFGQSSDSGRVGQFGNDEGVSSGWAAGGEYVDEEALLNMPNLLADMAEGMIISPPRMQYSDYSSANFNGDELWR